MNRQLFAVLALGAALPALASSPTAWEMNSYRDFATGRLKGLSLTRDGRLELAPRTDTVFASDQPIIWSVVQAPDGTIYAATGHRGQVFRIDPAGKSSLLWTAEQPEVFALALDAKGVLYAATSPDGRIFRIENGKAGEYFNPQAKYIWTLKFAPDGALYAGAGDQGRVYRITAAGVGELYYDTAQSHVTSLAIDAQGRLLAGTEPNGMLYRITAKDKAFVLYDAPLPEIRAIVPMQDGTVYAAALGGSMARKALGGVQPGAGMPSTGSVAATSTSITVEAQAGVEIKPKPDGAKPAAAAAAPAQAVAAVEVAGVDKSALYRIAPDNTVETLWTSRDENVYDLLVSGGQLTFSTDGQGRIYRLGADRKATLVTETGEGEAVRLLETPAGLLAATGDAARLYRLAAQPGAEGVFEAPVHDSGNVARWGRLSWLAAGGRIAFRTRSGNSLRPDRTWSDWSEPLADPSGSQIASPNARYIQWKAEFSGAAPVLDSVTLAYLPQNSAPVVKSISIITQLAVVAPKAAPAAAAASYAITVTDTGEAGPTASTGTATQNVGRPGAGQLQISWQAEDSDGDRLVYALWFRGEDEREWKQLKSNLTDASYTIDADSLADGRYLFRVVASDSPSNAPSVARDAEMVSAPVLVDQTPPVMKAALRGGEIDVEAIDAASPIRRAEYSIDAAPWVTLDPVEGILDSPRERFLIKLGALPAGEHIVVVRAVDSANNAGLVKVILGAGK